MMQDYKTLDTSVLIDMLMTQTVHYTSKIAGRESPPAELSQYEYDISLIQAELEFRKGIDISMTDVPALPDRS